jgi:hypothetical protein
LNVRIGALVAACSVAACGTLVVSAADDGGAPDAGVNRDAASDVEGGQPGCDARFCSDFDPPFDEAPFEWVDAGGDASLFARADLALSPPNALAVVTSSSDPLAFLVEPVAGWALPLRIEFSVRIEATSGSGALLQLIHVKCGASPDKVTVKLGPAGSWFLIVSGSQSLASLPPHAWQPIVLELRADATTLTTPAGVVTESPCIAPQEIDLGSTEFSSTDDKGIYDVRIDRVRFR